MNNFNKILLIFSAFCVLLLFFPGMYYEDISDVNYMILSQGYMTSEPVALFNNYGAHFILSHLYIHLKKAADLNWYAIINSLLMLIAGINTFFCISLASIKYTKSIRILLLAATSLFIFHDVIFLQYTKTSIYLIFSSIWILTYNWRHTETIRINPKLFIIQCLLLLTGILLRQFSIFLIGLVYFPILAIEIIRNPVKKWSEMLIPAAVFFFSTFIVIYLALQSYNPVDQAYGAFADFKNSVWDNGQQANSLNIISKEDSIAIDCIYNYFLPELKIIDPKLLKHIGIAETHSPVYQFSASLQDLPNKILLARDRWTELASEPSRLLVLFILIILILATGKPGNKLKYKQSVLIIWFLISLMAISVFAKMEERVLYPTLLILLILLVEIGSSVNDKILRFNHILIIIVFCLFSAYCLRVRLYEVWLRHKGQQEIYALAKALQSEHSDKVILLDWLSLNLLGNKVKWDAKKPKPAKWFTLDPGYLIFYPQYYKKEAQLTTCADFKSLILHMQENKNKFIFIYAANRIDILQRYCLRMYGLQLHFKLKREIHFDGNIINGHCNFYQYILE